jgi:hypothetical protein
MNLSFHLAIISANLSDQMKQIVGGRKSYDLDSLRSSFGLTSSDFKDAAEMGIYFCVVLSFFFVFCF